MTLIFDVFFDILAKWENMAETNVFFERSIFEDFLDGQKSRSQTKKIIGFSSGARRVH